MGEESLVVVGDGYAGFARNAGVVTAGGLIGLLGQEDAPRPPRRVILGLGLDDEQRQWLTRRLDALAVSVVDPARAAASLALTHKTAPENVLISELVALQPLEYACHLRLDAGTDRLSDHVTGQHVGAMILMEAARQAGIAALELALRRERCSFILQRFNSSYAAYAFPVPTRLGVQVKLHDDSGARQVGATLAIAVSQAEVEVAHVDIEVTVCEGRLLDRMETRRAEEAARRALQAQGLELELQ